MTEALRPSGLRGMWGRMTGAALATRLRLLSGLTLFTFVSTHLLNHSLGLVSLDVMLAGQRMFFAVWHSLPGTAVLTLAPLTHLSLVLYKQVVRPTLRMPWIEGLRILLGVVTLFGISLHATPMLVQRLVLGNPVRYPDFIVLLTTGSPILWTQLTLVIAAWTHGCIGVHLWLRLRAWYRQRIPLFTALAALVPVLALLGVLSGAREAHDRKAASGSGYGASSESGGYGDYGSSGGSYGAPSSGSDYGSSGGSYGTSSSGSGDGSSSGGYGSDYGSSSGGYGSDYGSSYGGGSSEPSLLTRITPPGVSPYSVYGASSATLLLLLVIAARIGVQAWERRRGQVTVRYPGGREVRGMRGASVLDISRMGGVPHASVCGGRGRCSTCRVHIDAGWDVLPPPQEGEQRVLQRIKAPGRVRLACQLCPTADLAVTPLVPANARARDSLPYDRMLFGMEQEIVILFADLRGFTKMSESKLPYDVVHILNAYFAEMGEAIETAGGYLDKFIGDGIMALFGLRDGVQAGAHHALAAARMMGQRLEELNARLALDLATPLRLGIGIHVGHVIVGEMGYKRATSLTAIGDSVNVASRLESSTKEAGCELLISAEVAERGGIDLSAFPRQQITVRGREGGLSVIVVRQAVDLPQLQAGGAERGGGVLRGPADSA